MLHLKGSCLLVWWTQGKFVKISHFEPDNFFYFSRDQQMTWNSWCCWWLLKTFLSWHGGGAFNFAFQRFSLSNFSDFSRNFSRTFAMASLFNFRKFFFISGLWHLCSHLRLSFGWHSHDALQMYDKGGGETIFSGQHGMIWIWKIDCDRRRIGESQRSLWINFTSLEKQNEKKMFSLSGVNPIQWSVKRVTRRRKFSNWMVRRNQSQTFFFPFVNSPDF